MEQLPVPVRPVSESLLEAALHIEEAGDSPAALHRALGDGAVAIEYQLDTLSAQLRLGEEDSIEPRLRPAAEQLEAELHGLLTKCWTAVGALVGGSSAATLDLAALVSEIRSAARAELDMVFESFRAPGGTD